MIELTDEQRQALQRTGETPLFIDPRTKETYVLVRADLYERVRRVLEGNSAVTDIPAGVHRSQEAFWRELPGLLADRKNHGRWVSYHGEERVGIARTDTELIRACARRGIRDDACYLATIRPRALPPWEPEEVEALGAQHLEED